MKIIKIQGGGIAGLTAAINLRNAGFNVEVHETKTYCGKKTNDFQFLENWTFDIDALEFLRTININNDFYAKPWYSTEILSSSLKRYVGRSTQPLMYLVKRGKEADSIDRSLERQAKLNNVKIVYNSKVRPNEVDIIATGPKKPTFVVTGAKFRLDHPDKSVVLLDNGLSLKFYSYFIVNDNVGEIACVTPSGTKDLDTRLRMTIDSFQRILNIEVSHVEEKFSETINLGYLNKASQNDQHYVGEAAGFQDHLAGFGMIYAFKSGYYAAKSIAENLEYDLLWKKDFVKQLKISASNRTLLERLSNTHFDDLIDLLNSRNFIMRRLRGGDDLQGIMRRLYNSSIAALLFSLIIRRKRKIVELGRTDEMHAPG